MSLVIFIYLFFLLKMFLIFINIDIDQNIDWPSANYYFQFSHASQDSGIKDWRRQLSADSTQRHLPFKTSLVEVLTWTTQPCGASNRPWLFNLRSRGGWGEGGSSWHGNVPICLTHLKLFTYLLRRKSCLGVLGDQRLTAPVRLFIKTVIRI